MLKYQARKDFDEQGAQKDSLTPGDNIEEAREDFLSPSAGKKPKKTR